MTNTHVELSVDKKINFECENLEIDDCKITGSDNGINLGKILKLDVNKSEFKNFKNGVFDVESVANIVLTNNTFDDCCKNVGCELIAAPTLDEKSKFEKLLDKGEASNYWESDPSWSGYRYGIPVLKSADSGVVLQVKCIEKNAQVNICNNIFNKCISNVPRGVVINFGGELVLKENVVIAHNSFKTCECKQNISGWKKQDSGSADTKWYWKDLGPKCADKEREVALFYYDNDCIKKLVCESLVYLGEEHCYKTKKGQEARQSLFGIFGGISENFVYSIKIGEFAVGVEKQNKNQNSNLSVVGDTCFSSDSFVRKY